MKSRIKLFLMVLVLFCITLCACKVNNASDSIIKNSDEIALIEIVPAVYDPAGITVTDAEDIQKLCDFINSAPVKEKTEKTVIATGNYNYIKLYDKDNSLTKSITFEKDWYQLDGYRYTVEQGYFEPILSQLDSQFADVNFDSEKPFAFLNAEDISSITVFTQQNGLLSVTDKTVIKDFIQKLLNAGYTKSDDTEQSTDFFTVMDGDKKCILSVTNLTPSGFTLTYPEGITYTVDTDILQFINTL